MLAGALIGIIDGLTGVGGGALMTPILLLFFAISPVIAVATDLWFAAQSLKFLERWCTINLGKWIVK